MRFPDLFTIGRVQRYLRDIDSILSLGKAEFSVRKEKEAWVVKITGRVRGMDRSGAGISDEILSAIDMAIKSWTQNSGE